MRKYLHINLADRSVRTEELQGEAIVRSGRYFIAKTLLEMGAASVEPMSPQNPLIFSAGLSPAPTFPTRTGSASAARAR